MSEATRIVQIGGVKLEVDLREAKVIESYKIGDTVKVLVKEYSSIEVYPGVIVSFDDFPALPTITVAYLKSEYNSASVEFAHLNEQSAEKYQIAPLSKLDRMNEKSAVLEHLDRKIVSARETTRDLETKKQYFLAHFEQYFQAVLV